MISQRKKKNNSNELKLSGYTEYRNKIKKKSKFVDKKPKESKKPNDKDEISEYYSKLMRIHNFTNEIRAGKKIKLTGEYELEKLKESININLEYIDMLKKLIDDTEFIYMNIEEGQEPFLIFIKKKNEEEEIKEELPNIDNIDNVLDSIEINDKNSKLN